MIKEFIDVYNLYIMYDELFTLSLQKNDDENAKKSFEKTLKYFNAICSNLNNAGANDQSKKKFLAQLELKLNAAKQKFVEKFGGIPNSKNSNLDKFEKLFETEDLETANKNLFENAYSKGLNFSTMNFLKRIVTINPDNHKIYLSLAKYYENLKMYKNVIACLIEFDKYAPGNPRIYTSIGVFYSKIDFYNNLDIRKKYFEKANELEPNNVNTLRGLALTCKNSGDIHSCLKYYKKILEIDPNHNDYSSYSYLNIQVGNFKEGTKYLDYRFTKEIPVKYPDMKKPQWDGKTNLEDKTLLVECEQGYGDSIMFSRYIPQIKAKQIIFRVPNYLFDLLKMNFPNIEIVPKVLPIEDIPFDYHIPMISLLNVCNARKETIPLSDGYIQADNKKIEKYKQKYFNNDCFKIGISWQGRMTGDKYRNVPLECFYPLTEFPNVQVYSLQKNADEEIQKSISNGVNIINLGTGFKNFTDTAAAIANVDLMVTSDNVVLNLAGAMGKKTFLLLTHDAEWRWFTDEKKTPWYNSVEIFKKTCVNESWDTVMDKILEKIKTFTQQ